MHAVPLQRALWLSPEFPHGFGSIWASYSAASVWTKVWNKRRRPREAPDLGAQRQPRCCRPPYVSGNGAKNPTPNHCTTLDLAIEQQLSQVIRSSFALFPRKQ